MYIYIYISPPTPTAHYYGNGSTGSFLVLILSRHTVYFAEEPQCNPTALAEVISYLAVLVQKYKY